MIEFLLKYWLEVLLGAIVTGLSFACKKFYKLYKAEQEHQKTKEQEEFQTEIKRMIEEVGKEFYEETEQLRSQVNTVISGMLSIHSKAFKKECRELLQDDREISLEEFETLQREHDVYKSLGGNHDGDTLFDMVQKKATHNLTD